MEQAIGSALENDRIRVEYHPIFDLASGLLVGAEALLRMTDAAGRPVAPAEVIPAAEASGQIVEIGRRVLRIAARQSAQWRAQHGAILPIAVNVSAVQLSRSGFVRDVLDAVEAAGVPPRALSIELTESLLLGTGSGGIAQLRDLRDAGVELAIDDFGTGYASLSMLYELPASTLKIDQTFVAGIPDDRRAMAIVAGVIALAKNFEMTCIAEGVESEAQREYLAERGVLGQGYLLGRPADGATMGRMIDQIGMVHGAPAAAYVSVAEARDRAGDQRDRAADHRDLVADARDQVGAERDDAAERRDHDAERIEADPRREQATEAGRRHAMARHDAAGDRHRSSLDRLEGATERSRAGADRDTALTYRDTGATERFHAELDRNIASADRGSGADARARSAEDRTTAHADHDASERERGTFVFDDLTATYVRGPGLAELDLEILRATQVGDSVVLALVDVDGLKQVNDADGHAAGDRVLRQVADALRTHLRPDDIVIRFGGDEFVCAISGLPLADAEFRLARVNADLATCPGEPSVTSGLAEMRAGDSARTLITRADEALVQQRRDG